MMTKSKFMQDCFAELLSDGKPHSVRELRAYMIEKSKGTEFEGTLEHENVVNRVQPLIKEHSPYERIKHGVYQLQPPRRWTTTPLNAQASASTPVVVSTGFAMIEKRIAELQREMKDTFMICFLCDKDKANAVENIYNRACENLSKTVDDISLWKNAYEHPEILGLQEQQEAPAEEESQSEEPQEDNLPPLTDDEESEDEELTEDEEETQGFGMSFGGMS